MKKVILTGDRPTGRLHVGHYVGSLSERVKLQNSGNYDEIYIMIADAQALTDNAEHPEKVRQNIIQVALDYLACGIDPEKSTIFIQSMVPELTELTFYYMNLVTVARVQRNPTVKSEIQMRNFEASIPVGFFCYPISQAADITAFRATAVPVGEDQLPMLEQCKEIVHKFNTVYGETLTEPEIVLPSNKACLRLPGIDGKAKMSKSLGNCIYLSDEADEVKKKVMSMFTDPNHLRVQDPGNVDGNPVFIYLDAFCKPEYFPEFLPDYQNLDELKDHYKRGGLGDVKVKKFLNNVLQAELGPIREHRKMWEQRIPDVYDILREGSKVAEAKAAETLRDVKASMKINLIPRLLIEPLVENAVSHGLEPKREKGNLQVLLYEREMLYIWVKDDGVGVGQNQMKAEENKENIPHTHVGWENTKKMLRILYGDHYKFQVWSEPGKGTEIEIAVPIERGGNYVESDSSR